MSGRLWLRSPFDPSTLLRIRVSGKRCRLRVGGAVALREGALDVDCALESAGEFMFGEGRAVGLKGISGKQRLFEVQWQ